MAHLLNRLSRWTRKGSVLSLAALVTALCACSSLAAQLRVTRTDSLGPYPTIGEIADAAVAPDGSLYLADFSNARVVHLSQQGPVLRVIGRSGEGPGEFRGAYRLSVSPEGELLVYDVATREISYFDSAGVFLSRTRLPYGFAQVDRVLGLSGRRVAVAGVAQTDWPGRNFGVHLFTWSMKHLASFGPLTPVRLAAVLRYWGAGSMSRSPDNALIYAPKQPYLIYAYRPEGQVLDSVVVPMVFRSGPEDLFQIAPGDSGGIHVRINHAARVTIMQTPYLLSAGRYLTGRLTPEAVLLDLVVRNQGIVSTVRLPPEIGACLTFDQVNRTLWCLGQPDADVMLYRLKLAISR